MKPLILKKMFHAAAFAAAVAVSMEICARIDDFLAYRAPLWGEYSQESMLAVRDSSGIRGRAHGRYEKWVLNGMGFRGPEYNVRKDPHVLRIAVMGASESFGIFETPGKEWPRQLDAGLRAAFPGDSVEVVNAAFPGMSLESALPYYERNVKHLRPDLVLLYVNFLPFLARVKTAAAPAAAPVKPGGITSLLHPGKPRLLSKLNRAWHERGPKHLTAAAEKRWQLRRYLAFNRVGQIAAPDPRQVDKLSDRLRVFIQAVRADGASVVLSEHAHALTIWQGRDHPEAWLNLWKYRPEISETAFRTGYPMMNETLSRIGKAESCLVVRQDDLLAHADTSFAADGLHLTDKGAARAAQNFLAAVRAERISRDQRHASDRVGRRITLSD